MNYKLYSFSTKFEGYPDDGNACGYNALKYLSSKMGYNFDAYEMKVQLTEVLQMPEFQAKFKMIEREIFYLFAAIFDVRFKIYLFQNKNSSQPIIFEIINQDSKNDLGMIALCLEEKHYYSMEEVKN